MVLFDGNKTELQSRLIELEKQVAVKDELLNQKMEEVSHLREQVNKLQDAFLAVQHPTAYRQLRDDQFAANADYIREPDKDAKAIKWAVGKYLDGIEKATFMDADDMIEKLSWISGSKALEEHSHLGPGKKSLHDNSES